MRVASCNNIPALKSGDVSETKRWLNKQIRILRDDIRRGDEARKPILETMLKIFQRELLDIS